MRQRHRQFVGAGIRFAVVAGTLCVAGALDHDERLQGTRSVVVQSDADARSQHSAARATPAPLSRRAVRTRKY